MLFGHKKNEIWTFVTSCINLEVYVRDIMVMS